MNIIDSFIKASKARNKVASFYFVSGFIRKEKIKNNPLYIKPSFFARFCLFFSFKYVIMYDCYAFFYKEYKGVMYCIEWESTNKWPR